MINRRRILVSVLLYCVIGGVYPASSFSSEETVTLSFSRHTEERLKTRIYRIKQGEHLCRIVMKELSLSLHQAMMIMDDIKALNPHIKDVDRIFAGQKLVLPLLEDQGELKTSERSAMEKPSSNVKKSVDMISYTVKPGDNITYILHRTYGISRREALKYTAAVAAANPRIRDINKIYVGQRLLLPTDISDRLSMEREEDLTPQKYSSFSLSPEGAHSFLKDMMGLLGGEIINEGYYYVPLPPMGQLTVDCSRVPVAEFTDGQRILIDMEGRISPALGAAMTARWKNYHVLSGAHHGDIFDIVDKVARVPGFPYRYERKNRQVVLGNNPEVMVFFDGILEADPASQLQGFDAIGIRLLDDKSEALPFEVKSYVNRKGMAVVELLNGEGPVASERTGGSFKTERVARKGGIALAQDILRKLGFVSQRNREIPIATMEKDGFNLSVKADLFLETEDRRIVIASEDSAAPLRAFLAEQGIAVIVLPNREGDEGVIQSVVAALDVPLKNDSFLFPLPVGKSGHVEHIKFSAFRVEGKSGVVYFVKGDFDEELYRLIRERWKVNVVVY